MKKRRANDNGRTQDGAYSAAGVDIDAKMKALEAVKRMIGRSATRGAIGNIGLFGGLFRAPGRDTILVASTDGVGTKLKVAVMAGRHDTVGQDIVNHCVNDILVQGATPLFLLDYFGTSRFDPAVFTQVVHGLCRACRQNGCALLGGETAEMPGLYPPGEYDLVATIVGAVAEKHLIVGKGIRPGDSIIGLPSSGLHTNGYSLARRVIFEKAGLDVRDRLPGSNRTVAEVLLAVHRSYLRPVTFLMKHVAIRGMAHITGGGFPDNIRRILPDGCAAQIFRKSWTPPAIFRFIQEQGNVSAGEMYRVFNMGIGYTVFVRPCDEKKALDLLARAGCPSRVIGRVERGRRNVEVV